MCRWPLVKLLGSDLLLLLLLDDKEFENWKLETNAELCIHMYNVLKKRMAHASRSQPSCRCLSNHMLSPYDVL